jgi:hypothetical protein
MFHPIRCNQKKNDDTTSGQILPHNHRRMRRRLHRVSWQRLFMVAAVAAVVVIPASALAMTFNFTFDEGFLEKEQNLVIAAAWYWEASLKDEVVVNVRVGWGNPATMEDENGNRITGETTPARKIYRYRFLRDIMAGDEQREESCNGLLAYLPTAELFAADHGDLLPPDDLSVTLTQANAKALGLTKEGWFKENGYCEPQHPNDPAMEPICWEDHDATILFNPDAFKPWDVVEGKRDLIYVAMHELGHVLGFFSVLDLLKGNETSASWGPTALDIFRFGRDNTSLGNPPDWDYYPSSLAEFTLNPRNLSALDPFPALFMDFNPATGFFSYVPMNIHRLAAHSGGQASHWAQRSDGDELGIMDPGMESYINFIDQISGADLIAMDLIGWDLAFDFLEGEDLRPKLAWPWSGYTIGDVTLSVPNVIQLQMLINGVQPGSTPITNLSQLINVSDDLAADLINCDYVDCQSVSLERKMELAYMQDPLAVINAVLADYLQALEDPEYQPGLLPWLVVGSRLPPITLVDYFSQPYSDDDGDGLSEDEGDCDDADAMTHPGAAEICGDGVDNDCNGLVDDTCTSDCGDANQDGVVDLKDFSHKFKELNQSFNTWVGDCWRVAAECGDFDANGRVNWIDRFKRRSTMLHELHIWAGECWNPPVRD